MERFLKDPESHKESLRAFRPALLNADGLSCLLQVAFKEEVFWLKLIVCPVIPFVSGYPLS